MISLLHLLLNYHRQDGMRSIEGDKRGERRGSPDKLSKVGIEGPKMSVSKIPARWPSLAKARVRLTVAFPAPSEYPINFSTCQRG